MVSIGMVAKKQIAVKKRIPVVLAAAVWGKHWKGLDVMCHSDNQAVVAVICSRTSKDHDIMHLLRCLSFMEAWCEFSCQPSTFQAAAMSWLMIYLAIACPLSCRKLRTCH